ncbi:hypothetical protein [Trichormus sp. NMC-1]|uniref:hypothetical protein n=1 Tax=Trichormus sp. NMC-1 TaxID=1853259 RepID=UPI0015A733D7|nr:hypothetical protein [Trichormus sp. NMC-1]
MSDVRSKWFQAPDYSRGEEKRHSLLKSPGFRHGVSPCLRVPVSPCLLQSALRTPEQLYNQKPGSTPGF